ncbi:MAG: DNA replication and repair protein RecF [bacterium]|nr:DNA replication and repair protein RecF [bacterium]MDY2650167.1 DNA replication and repair protein RecF [Candidatus Egerieousia sp.]
MYLRKLKVINFKNIREATLQFSPKINCILGNNGGGKTNLLDAIYYLSMTKSFFNIPENYAVTFGEQSMGLIGDYMLQEKSECIHLAIKLPDAAGACQPGTQASQQSPQANQQGIGENQPASNQFGATASQPGESASQPARNEKQLWRNEKRIAKFSSHIGLLPIVMVSPQDAILVNGSGEERRRFLNFILSQTDPLYLSNIQNYNALLAQRNKLLKLCAGTGARSAATRGWDELIQTITLQMESPAAYVHAKRQELAESLSQYTAQYYKELSGNREAVTMRYQSDLNSSTPKEIFQRSQQQDLRFGYTTAGPHRDDMLFFIEGFPIKKVGSQGQQKSFLIALKLAQFQIIKQISGKLPILLLDDLFDKLDMTRVEYLLSLVAGETFGQIFITDSNKVRINQILARVDSTAKSFEVHGGTYLEQPATAEAPADAPAEAPAEAPADAPAEAAEVAPLADAPAPAAHPSATKDGGAQQ